MNLSLSIVQTLQPSLAYTQKKRDSKKKNAWNRKITKWPSSNLHYWIPPCMGSGVYLPPIIPDVPDDKK